MVFVALCCVALLTFILVIVSCTTITVQTGTGGSTVTEEADKGVILKPKGKEQ
jgi:hypothetical protein